MLHVTQMNTWLKNIAIKRTNAKYKLEKLQKENEELKLKIAELEQRS